MDKQKIKSDISYCNMIAGSKYIDKTPEHKELWIIVYNAIQFGKISAEKEVNINLPDDWCEN